MEWRWQPYRCRALLVRGGIYAGMFTIDISVGDAVVLVTDAGVRACWLVAFIELNWLGHTLAGCRCSLHALRMWMRRCQKRTGVVLVLVCVGRPTSHV